MEGLLLNTQHAGRLPEQPAGPAGQAAPAAHRRPAPSGRAAPAPAQLSLDRRQALGAALGGVALLGLAPGARAVESLSTYSDDTDRFSLGIPSGWVKTGGVATNSRKASVWHPESGPGALNVTVLVTNVGADFTKLGSFGRADEFGASLVASMDRSFLLRTPFGRGKNQKVQTARLIDARERGGMYRIEYTVQRPEEEEPRHLYSVVALGFDGRYQRLYTVTGQCTESEVPTYGPLLEACMQSFRPPANLA